LKHALSNAKVGMQIGFILIVCFSIAVFAQNEQGQEQYQYPQQQGQYQYPQQQGQYQYPQQQGQYQYPQQQQDSSNPDQRAAVQQLIKAGLMKNKDEIQKASIYLSPADKTALYNKNKKKAAGGWAALDFAVGFGIGSYIQGDIAFGVAQSLMDATAYTLMYIGILNIEEEYDDCYNYSYYGGSYCNHEYRTNEEYLDLMVAGLIVFGTSRIMSWIFPFVHQRGYNRTLNEALNTNNSFSYSIDPLIVPKTGMPAVGLAFNVHL